MAGVFAKAKNLLSQKNYAELRQKVIFYLRYMALRFWFFCTGKEWDNNLKKTKKHWITYTYLQAKYKNFLKTYPRQKNATHEYSDIVWWCWLQGEENAPDICKKCLASARKHLSHKKIIVITQENMFDYVQFPDYIMEKYQKGIITRTQFSDLLRLQLLVTHGGTWLDATVLLTGYPAYAFDSPLFFLQSRDKEDPAVVGQSWFLVAEKNEPILTLTRDMIFDYWKTHSYQLHYFIIYFFFSIAARFYAEEWKAVPFYSDVPTFAMERELLDEYTEKRFSQLCAMADIHKLSYKIEKHAENRYTFYEFILQRHEP